ncbi:hypothetical protein [Pimelobacter simplex]|uniref:hypothetical protein n=1 Tax=Nocardioides simplex TaxID=2045 RepID=UPI003AAF569F
MNGGQEMELAKANDKVHRESERTGFRRAWRAGATAVIVISLSLVWSAAPANADSDNICDYYGSDNCEYNNATTATDMTRTGDASSNGSGAWSAYKSSGDLIKARDTAPDGRSAVTYWELWKNGNQVRRGYCRNQQGAGTTMLCNKSFAAGSGTLCIQALEYNHENHRLSDLAGYVPCFTM